MFIHRSMIFIVTIFACLFCLTVQAIAQTPTPTPPQFQEAQPELRALLPAYDDADVIETGTGLRYVILEEGTGSDLRPCDIIRTRYSGYLADGTPFDTGRNRQFTIGAQDVSAGWDEGATYLLPGTKAILMVPADLGYGAEVVDDIPADSTLYYEIDVPSATRNLHPTEGVEMGVTLDSGITYGTMTTGTDPISDTQIIVMDYAIWETSGCLSSATVENDRQIVFQQRGPGSENVLLPMITGTVGIEVGETRQMFWPVGIMPDTAFETISYTVEVTVVNVFPAPPEPFLTITATEPITTERSVTYYTLSEGAGEEILDFQVLDIIYHVWNADGELIYTSYLSGLPSVAYRYAAEQIAGFDESLRNAHYGEVRQAFLPRGVAAPVTNADGERVFEDTIIQIEILMPEAEPTSVGVTYQGNQNGRTSDMLLVAFTYFVVFSAIVKHRRA